VEAFLSFLHQLILLSESGSGVVGDGRVFGISISKCIQNDKVKAAKDLSSRRRKIAGLFDHTQQVGKKSENDSRNTWDLEC